ncbi:MAG: sensor histidine kinase [Clostridiales bacterium]|nr:sensor histidine kinase [Clostridiales bacterium]
MRELSLHILDIVQNSVKAEASVIEIDVNIHDGYINITIKDNGKGMDKELLNSVTNPFTTSRKTRKVGLGIPLIKMAAEKAGGSFKITSEKGVGTVVYSSFQIDHIDRMPLGDISETIVTLLDDKTDFVWKVRLNEKEFVFDTREVKNQLNPIPIDSVEVLVYLKSYIKENIESIIGGIIL